MEAYTLWWNGDCLCKFLRLNSKASETISYTDVLKTKTLAIEDCRRIVAFRKNRAMLARALIYIMGLVHKAKIIHNNLTPSNVLLHFPPDDVQSAYIGVCNWGMASRTVENKASYFGKSDKFQCKELRRAKPGMAPELFFMYGTRDNEKRNLERMKNMHLYTMGSDAFLVGYLARMIWNNEDSKELFKTKLETIIFRNKLGALVHEDPRRRPSLVRVVEDLMDLRYHFPVPDSCFRHML